MSPTPSSAQGDEEITMPKKRLRVAERCDVPYDAMTPRGRGRHCADCDRVVVNVSALTERQALSLFRERGGDLCGYVQHDGGGNPLFRPEPRAGVAMGALLAGALAACEPNAEPEATAAPLMALAPASDAASDDATNHDAFVMMPISESSGTEVAVAEGGLVQGSEPNAASSEPTAASDDAVALDDVVATDGAACGTAGEPTAEDRALERRKRRRRQVHVRPRPHEQFAGMMMLME